MQIAKTRKYSEKLDGIVEISGEPIPISDDVFKNAIMQFFSSKFDKEEMISPHNIESQNIRLTITNLNDKTHSDDTNYIYLIKRPPGYVCYPEDGPNSILVCASSATAALDVEVDGYITIKWYEDIPKDKLEVICLG